jgi:4-hydroxybutyrate CoA-transferase
MADGGSTVKAIPVTKALADIPAGAHVVATTGCGTPEMLLRELPGRGERAPGIVLAAGLLNGAYPFVDGVRAGAIAYRTWHVAAPIRDLVGTGVVEYLPMRLSDVPALVARWTEVLLVRVSPPNRHGYCSFGPAASYTRAALSGARLVIAEVDDTLPRTYGDTAIHVSEIDHLVESDTPTPLYESAVITEESRRIASYIIDLLPREPTVQVGIGSIPEAVAVGLAEADLGPLGVVGMGCDGHLKLFETGALPRTRVMPDPAVQAVELMGTRTLLDFADDNPSIAMIPSTTCHDPQWLSRIPRLVSINSAIEIDLSGQVGSEMINGQMISAIGGSFDFFEGAHWSPGGLRIIAMQAATANGKFSKIVSQLSAGTAVTIPRHTVDVVVTEHGVAKLAGLSLRERAQALVAIADPAFRNELANSGH